MPRLIEDDMDAGYCPFCGVFVDGDFADHWCPESDDEDEWEDELGEEIDWEDDE